MTAEPEWDSKPISLAHEIADFLRRAVIDEGTQIDSGTDGTTGDLACTVQGVRYGIEIKRLA